MPPGRRRAVRRWARNVPARTDLRRPYLVYRRKAATAAYGHTATPHGHAPARREAGTRKADMRFAVRPGGESATADMRQAAQITSR
ncbi:hypothetical protein [Streptomyces thermolilacinus]|uniref:hypothetical protein n=1 Tax=Streptomyces thermolilacinus TaxID=285540 RepID=UPI0033D82B47